MIGKIGRNDKCPCMSGKKYKNCCEKDLLVKDLKERGIIKFDEKYFFKDVMDDIMFKNYYEANRLKIDNEIITGIIQNHGASMSYGTYPITSNENKWFIVNNTVSPVQKFKSLEAAHELQHIINHYNGYPSVSFKKEYLGNNNLACKNISDMLNDPMVNGEIMKYGFDMKSYFEKADRIQIPAIETFIGHEKNTFVITLCVKRYLDYKNIDPNIRIEDISFIKYCKEKYISLEVFWLQIISWIRQIGYKTKESADLILNKTIELLGYQQYMELKYF